MPLGYRKKPIQTIAAVNFILACLAIGAYLHSTHWAVREVNIDVLRPLWTDTYIIPKNRHLLGTVWPQGLSSEQSDVAESVTHLYIAILGEKSDEVNAFHGQSVSRVVEVEDVQRFSKMLLSHVTSHRFSVDDHLGQSRFGIRFVSGSEAGTPSRCIDLVLYEAYSVALVYSPPELRHVVFERDMFETLRILLNDDVLPGDDFQYRN